MHHFFFFFFGRKDAPLHKASERISNLISINLVIIKFQQKYR